MRVAVLQPYNFSETIQRKQQEERHISKTIRLGPLVLGLFLPKKQVRIEARHHTR
jgi:hypothetical protein